MELLGGVVIRINCILEVCNLSFDFSGLSVQKLS